VLAEGASLLEAGNAPLLFVAEGSSFGGSAGAALSANTREALSETALPTGAREALSETALPTGAREALSETALSTGAEVAAASTPPVC
jgi:hypothetical protein